MAKLLKSKKFQAAVGFLVSAVLLIWVFSSVKWEQVAHKIAEMDWFIFVPLLALTVLIYVLRAWRWHELLPQEDSSTLRQRFDAIIVGNFASFVLPLRAGEFVRSFMLSRYSRLSFSTCFVSVIVERFFDLAIVLISFAFVMQHVQGIPEWVQDGAHALLFLGAMIFMLMLAGTFFPGQLLKVVSAVCSFLPLKLRQKLLKFTEDFFRGAAILNHGSRLLKVVLLSLAVWATCYAISWVYFLLFNFNPGIWPAISVAVIIALAVAAPSAPGFIGVYQAGCVAGFDLFGLDKETAVAYSIVTHLFQYVIFVAYGMYVLLHEHLELREISASREKLSDSDS